MLLALPASRTAWSAPGQPAPATLPANSTGPLTTSSFSPAPGPASPAPYELRLRPAAPGKETLALAARLSPSGGYLIHPVTWLVRRDETGTGHFGETVFRAAQARADFPARPGTYRITAAYGHTTSTHTVTVLPGRHLAATFVLNAGAIRAMSSLSGAQVPLSIRASHTITALTGPRQGQVIVARAGQGHISRLAAQTYRVTSRFAPGNTIAGTIVTVKPGIMSSLNITHIAGLVHFEFATGHNATGVRWTLINARRSWQTSSRSPAATLILAPGAYTLTARINRQIYTRTFTIIAGKNPVVRIPIKTAR